MTDYPFTAALQDRLRRVGIVDTSLCRDCLDRWLAREAAEAAAALKATQRPDANGRQMWSTLASTMQRETLSRSRMARTGSSSIGDGDNGGDGEAPARVLRPHETLSSLDSGLAMLTLDEREAAAILERGDRTLDADYSCTRCRGGGKDRVAQYAYSEECEMHALEDPGARQQQQQQREDPLMAFSPQIRALKTLLQSERSLAGLVRSKADLAKSSRVNSMYSGLGQSTILIRKPTNSTQVVSPTPHAMPKRDQTWLFAQFEEIRFPTPSSSSTALSSNHASGAASGSDSFQPPLTRLDVDLGRFVHLHTLHLSGQALRTLENLPANIRVVHAYGNRIETIKLLPPPVAVAPASKTKKSSKVSEASSPQQPKQPKQFHTLSGDPAPPIPPPAPALSSYPHLLHLGVGFNALGSLRDLTPLARTLQSLDASGNMICDLVETCAVLEGFDALKTLRLQSNPIALQKFYRAAILDVFVRIAERKGITNNNSGAAAAASAGAIVAAPSTLDTLDGYSVHAHLQRGEGGTRAAADAHTQMLLMGGDSAGSQHHQLPQDSSRSSARSGSTSGGGGEPLSDRSPQVSSRKAVAPAAASAAAASPAAAKVRKGKKPTAAELAEAAEIERLALLRAAEDARRAEETRLASLICRPTLAERSEPVRFMIVMEGGLKGLQNPRMAFDAEHAPAVSDEHTTGSKGKRASKERGLSTSSITGVTGATSGGDKDKSSAAAAGTAVAGSSGKKKRASGKSLDVDPSAPIGAADPDAGWFVASTLSQTMIAPGVSSSGTVDPRSLGGLISIRSLVRKRVRFYFEVRLPPLGQGGLVEPGISNQFGGGADPSAPGFNPGNGRGSPDQVYRSVEYEWEQLCGVGNGSSPLVCPAPPPAGSPASLRSSATGGPAFALEVAFPPSVAWRDMVSTLGLNILLYQHEEFQSTSESNTTMQPRPPPPVEDPPAAAGSTSSTPLVTRRGSTSSSTSSSSRREASAAAAAAAVASDKKREAGSDATTKKKSESKKKGKKGAVELLPPEIVVSSSSSEWDRHTLLGMGHFDCSSFLANHHGRRTQSTHVLTRLDFELRKPIGEELKAVKEPGVTGTRHTVPTTAAAAAAAAATATTSIAAAGGGGSPSPSPLPPPLPLPLETAASRAQWHPQFETRLPVEIVSVARALPQAIARAKEEGMEIKFKPLLELPPHIQLQQQQQAARAGQEEKESSSGPIVPPSTSSKSRSSGGLGGRPNAAERERLEREASQARHALESERQRQDPLFILPKASVWINCRPMQGVGSTAFRAVPPEPTPEEIAANAAAAAAQAAAQSNKRGRKSPAPTSKKANAAAAPPPVAAAAVPADAGGDDV